MSVNAQYLSGIVSKYNLQRNEFVWEIEKPRTAEIDANICTMHKIGLPLMEQLYLEIVRTVNMLKLGPDFNKIPGDSFSGRENYLKLLTDAADSLDKVRQLRLYQYQSLEDLQNLIKLYYLYHNVGAKNRVKFIGEQSTEFTLAMKMSKLDDTILDLMDIELARSQHKKPELCDQLLKFGKEYAELEVESEKNFHQHYAMREEKAAKEEKAKKEAVESKDNIHDAALFDGGVVFEIDLDETQKRRAASHKRYESKPKKDKNSPSGCSCVIL